MANAIKVFHIFLEYFPNMFSILISALMWGNSRFVFFFFLIGWQTFTKHPNSLPRRKSHLPIAFQRGGGGKVHPGNLWGEPVLGGRPSGPLPLRPLHKKHRQVVGANLWICSTMTSGVSRSSRESAAASEEMTDNDSWRFWASLKISGQYIMHHNPQKLLSM